MILYKTYACLAWNCNRLEVGGHHLPIEVLKRILGQQGFILWRYAGAYAIITLAIIANALDQWADRGAGKARYADERTVPVIWWEATLPLDPRVGRMLEQGEQFTDNGPPEYTAPSSKSDQQKTEPVEPLRGGA